MRSGRFLAGAVQAAMSNGSYRHVLVQGEVMQVAAMNILPRQSVGAETHADVEQLFLVVAGSGTAAVGRRKIRVGVGDVIIVPKGVRHDVRAGRSGIRLLTVYAPPEHLPGTVHRTRRDAEADEADKNFGESRSK